MSGIEKNNPDEATRITNAIVEGLGNCDLETALMVVCGIAGQLVAHMAEGNFTEVDSHATCLSLNIKRAAMAKMLHDDDKKRGH